MRDFRKHAGWYLTGYPAGPERRRRLAQSSSFDELDELLAELDPATTLPAESREPAARAPARPEAGDAAGGLARAAPMTRRRPRGLTWSPPAGNLPP